MSPATGRPLQRFRALPQLILISQDTFATDKIETLSPGSTWSRRSVTCTVAEKTVTCKNRSKHGFTIGHGHYKSF